MTYLALVPATPAPNQDGSPERTTVTFCSVQHLEEFRQVCAECGWVLVRTTAGRPEPLDRFGKPLAFGPRCSTCGCPLAILRQAVR